MKALSRKGETKITDMHRTMVKEDTMFISLSLCDTN